jgi:tetratricopeptide (TPR) repeat protein
MRCRNAIEVIVGRDRANTSEIATRKGNGARLVVGVGLSLLLIPAVAYAVWELLDYRRTPDIAEVDRRLAAGRFVEAAQGATAYLRWQPEDARAMVTLARARAALGDLPGCIAALERVPARSIRKPEALYRIGQAGQALGRARDAEAAYRASIRLDPYGPDAGRSARLALMAILAMEERVGEFKSLAWETYESLPEANRLDVLTMLTRIEYEQTRPEINAATLRRYLAADPADAQARAGLAAALDHANDPEAARSLYARAVAERPDDPELRERYMSLLQRMGDLESLRSVLAGRSAGSDARPATLKFIGLVAESAGDFAGARDAYARLAALAPDDPEAHHRLALALFRLGRKTEAQAETGIRSRLGELEDARRRAWDRFADAFDADPRHVPPDLVIGMARAAEAAGRRREAIAWYRRVLAANPRAADAQSALARLERDAQGKRPD